VDGGGWDICIQGGREDLGLLHAGREGGSRGLVICRDMYSVSLLDMQN